MTPEPYEILAALMEVLCRVGIVEGWNTEDAKVVGLVIKGVEYGAVDRDAWES